VSNRAHALYISAFIGLGLLLNLAVMLVLAAAAGG
jgi:hypothetical protein